MHVVRRLLPLLLALAALVAPAPAALARPMTVDDLWAMERVGSPELSPDGKLAVFTVTVWDTEKNTSDSDLWLVPSNGRRDPRRLTWNEGSDGSPAFRPDGKAIAFLSKRGEGPAQLYLLPLDGGEARRLTDLPFTPGGFRWFPDGKRIAFLGSTWADVDDDFEELQKRLDARKEDETKVKISDTRLVRYWDHYLDPDLHKHLFVLDVDSGEVKDLTPGSTRLLPFFGNSGIFDISPDGEEIAITVNSTRPPYRTLNFDVYTMPAGGGELVNRTADNPASDGSPLYSPDGRYLLFERNDRPEVHPDFSRFALLDRKTGKVRGLAEDWDGSPGSPAFTADGKQVVFHAQDAGRVDIFRVGVADGKVERVIEGGTTSGVRVAPDGSIVYAAETFHAPAELYFACLTACEPRPLTRFNAERMEGLDLGSYESVTFEGANGDAVQMWVLFPPGFDRTRKWPLLHLVHGGPHGAWTDRFHYRWNAALFAAPGYVTTAVNFHGSTGFGQAFAESILGAHADLPFRDMMAATDFMVGTGYVDEARMAAAGGSYGGYLVSWMLGHTDRFAAYVNHAGVYDLMAQFASDYTWGRANNYGAAPWTDPDRVDLWSPSRFAERFETPTLVIHGEKDYRVPYTQGLALHGVLTAKGVPSRLVIFPEENHWILKPQSARIWWDEVHGWLARWLAP